MKAKNVILAICIVGLAVSASAKPGKHRSQFQQVTTISGTIAEWTYNDDFEYDGLYLNTGGESVFVKFPAHLAEQVQALSNNLSVSGYFHFTRHGEQEFKMISITGNGQTVYEQKPMRQYNYVQEPYINGEGRVTQVQLSKSGNVHGYILDNGVILRASPRSSCQLAQMIQVGSVIGYSGIEKVLKQGHVRASNNKIVHGQTISVNGNQYVVR